MARKDFKLGRESKPPVLAPEAIEVSRRGNLEEMLAFASQPPRKGLEPISRRFVLAYIQGHYSDSLEFEKVIELSEPVIQVYDQLRVGFLSPLAEAHEALGNVERAHDLMLDLAAFPDRPDKPNQSLQKISALGQHHLIVGAYRVAAEWYDRAWRLGASGKPMLPNIAAQQLRALAFSDRLDRVEELRRRFAEELDHFLAANAESAQTHGPLLSTQIGLANLLVHARLEDRQRVAELEADIEAGFGNWSTPVSRFRMRLLECSAWARLWLGDATATIEGYGKFRSFLARHNVPPDRAVLLAAAAERELGLELGAASDIHRIANPAILFRASRLMSEAHPNRQEFADLQSSAGALLPDDLRSAVA